MSGSRIQAFPAAPEGSLERMAAISAKAHLDAAKAEEQKSIILGKVPKEIRDRIEGLHDSADNITTKFYGAVKPLLQSLTEITQKEIDIIKSAKAFWEAHHSKNSELRKSIHETICANSAALAESSNKLIITDSSDVIPALEKRLRLLTKELSKIDQSTAKEAYDLYMRRYNVLKEEVESCKKYQAQVTSWIELERNKSVEMNKKIKEINWACDGNQPNPAPEEFKAQAAQPASPTKSNRSDSDSDHSPSHSANHSPKDEKDSPPFNPNSGKDIKAFSLPQPVFGSNSQAIQYQQKQKLAAAQQYQNPPAYNPAAALGNGK